MLAKTCPDRHRGRQLTCGSVPAQSFDDLLLMKYGGSVIYHGHLGKRSHRLIEYFRAVPGVPDLQEGLNPATWMLQVSTPGMETTLGVDYAEIYRQSDLFRCVTACRRHTVRCLIGRRLSIIARCML